jgi:hypothetical protein
MAFYEEMAALALELLAEFGVEAVVTKRADAVYDSDSGKAVRAAPTTHTVRIAFKQQPEGQKGNSAVAKNKREVIISATDTSGVAVSIDAEDNITQGGRVYKVVDPGPVAPAGVVVVYDAVLEA